MGKGRLAGSDVRQVDRGDESAEGTGELGVDAVYCPIPPAEGLLYGTDWELTWNTDECRGS